MKLHYRFSLFRKDLSKGRRGRENQTNKKRNLTTTTSCLVWTARLLSTHCIHIHRYRRKLSTFGTSIKTLSCQRGQWTGNSTAPLCLGRINAASKRVKVLLGERWRHGEKTQSVEEVGDSFASSGWELGLALFCGGGNAPRATLFLSWVGKGIQRACLSKLSCLKKTKWAQYFHLKISFKGILNCLRRWIHCVCFLH